MRKLIIIFSLFLSFGVSAQERFYSSEFQRCSKIAASLEGNVSCIGAEIVVQKKRLNSAYAKLTKNLNPEDKVNFDKVQREWIAWRDDNYDFLAEHVPGEFGTVRVTSLDFMLRAIFDRAGEIEMILDEVGENSSRKE